MAWSIQVSDAESPTITVTFSGELSPEEGMESAEAIAESLEALGKANLTFDLTDMEGYEAEARQAWETHLDPHKERILTFNVKGGNNTCRMAVSVLALSLGVTLTKV